MIISIIILSENKTIYENNVSPEDEILTENFLIKIINEKYFVLCEKNKKTIHLYNEVFMGNFVIIKNINKINLLSGINFEFLVHNKFYGFLKPKFLLLTLILFIPKESIKKDISLNNDLYFLRQNIYASCINISNEAKENRHVK